MNFFDYRDDPLETKNHAKLYPDVLEKNEVDSKSLPDALFKSKTESKINAQKSPIPQDRESTA